MQLPSLRSVLLIPILTLLVATVASGSPAPTIVMADAVKWTAGTGALAGTQVAVLSGNPATAGGMYTMRLKLPDGFKFGPHMHPMTENVTVISGTLLVGLGDKMNTSKMMALSAGSFAAVPAGLHHYAMARGQTILQLTGVGPEAMTEVK
ncbi:MAG: cupin domain-containing protein [Candidatus Eremiobacteraeota bacterium]|nr:cupin domain-containing protein [Candidatus Eremiobacteraeota bacterium]